MPRIFPAPRPAKAAAVESAQNTAIQTAAQRARKRNTCANSGCDGASTVPVPGLDWAVDAALLSRLLPQISAEFGLTPAQLDALDPHKRDQVQKAVAMVGSVLIGKFITRDLALKAVRTAGMRMTTKQLSNYIPLAGQAVSAALGYATLRFLGEQHIRDCIAVAEAAQLRLPPPAV